MVKFGQNKREKVYYHLLDPFYKGSFPTFYNERKLPGTKILEENYQTIRDEVLQYFRENKDSIQPNFTPYAYKEEGWRTMNLYSYFMRYPGNCEPFPQTEKIVRSIPGLCGVQIAVLKPNTRIKAHRGDTNVVMRSHLGLQIPGKWPDLGMQFSKGGFCWDEGKVTSFCIAHKHYAWNYTDEYRIMLQVDVMREEYRKDQYLIAGNVLAGMFMKLAATNFPVLKSLPRPLAWIIQRAFGLGLSLQLILQRKVGIDISKLFMPFRRRQIQKDYSYSHSEA